MLALSHRTVKTLRADRHGFLRAAPTRPMERFRDLFDGGDRVALFVDGPNVLRDEFDVDLDDVREAAAAEGDLAVARLYLDEHAPAGLVQAAEARGFEVRVTSGDVDVKLAVDAAALVTDGVDVLAVASRDTDFKPLLELAARRGARTLAIAPGEHGRSDALRNAANAAVTLDE
jgi:uncharacterized protein (TIGR00288 family)